MVTTATVLYEVVMAMLSGIRLAYPIAQQYDTDDAVINADEAIHFYLKKAMKEFANLEDCELYESALDAIRQETTKLVEHYSNLKPNYQSR